MAGEEDQDQGGARPLDDLIEQVRDMRKEIRQDILAARREQNQGFRAVHEKIDDHAKEDRDGFNTIGKTVSELGERVARLEGQQEGEQQANEANAVQGFFGGPNGTGKHPRLPSSPDLAAYSAQQQAAAAMGFTPPYGTQVPTMVIPTPPVGVPMEVRIGHQEKRSSIPPVLSWITRMVRKMFRSTAGKVGSVVGLVLAGWFTRHVMDPLFGPKPVDGPATVLSATHVEHPFPSAEPPTLPAIPAAMGVDASVQGRDSGAGSHR